jgi:hypothetical protein
MQIYIMNLRETAKYIQTLLECRQQDYTVTLQNLAEAEKFVTVFSKNNLSVLPINKEK